MHFSVDTSTAGRVRETGRCERRRPLTVRVLPGPMFRYSPVVSKKQGSAPARNRVKRILRECMRESAGSFAPGYYLVSYNGPCAAFNRDDVRRSLLEIAGALAEGKR